MILRSIPTATSILFALILAGCGGSPEPEKVVIKKEDPAPQIVSAPDETEQEHAHGEAGNLGASHPQETARDQEQKMAESESASSPSPVSPKEGYTVSKAVDGMGRGTLHFLVPDEWESSQPSSSMRIGQFSLPGETGPAELAVFGPMGGGVQMNIDRWIGQVEQPDGSSSKDKAIQEKIEGAQFETTFLDVTGTYKGMQMPGGPAQEDQENYRLLASIVETPSGPWFFKATGPHETLEEHVEGFKEMNLSIQMEGGKPAGSGSAY